MSEQRSRAFRWSSIGGHLALDLCNTVSWRLDESRLIDRLATPPDVVDWFGTVTDLPTADRDRLARQVEQGQQSAEKALRSVKELRDATTRTIDAQVDGRATGTVHVTTASADVDLISAAWRRALAVATTPAQLPWQWRVEPTDPENLVHVLALSVADLLHRPDQSGLRRCYGDGCGWLFLDTTRNHSRRWCDPLDCGNRTRVRNYAQRHRKPSGGHGSAPLRRG